MLFIIYIRLYGTQMVSVSGRTDASDFIVEIIRLKGGEATKKLKRIEVSMKNG